jgi:Fe-S-cluster containining protein
MCADDVNKPKTQKHCAAFVIDESDRFDNNLCNELNRTSLNIDIFGKELNLIIGFADVPVQICDIVPPAQAICDIIVKAAISQAQKSGQNTHCRKGCNCCRNSVPMSIPEALWLCREINLMPNSERKVLQRSIELARRKQISVCPFLSDNTCTIYYSRPLACREHIVTGSNLCDASDNQNSRPLQLPVSMLESVICLCGELDENITETIMLPAAIGWAQNSKDLLTKTYNMSELLGRLVDIIHQRSEKTAQVF